MSNWQGGSFPLLCVVPNENVWVYVFIYIYFLCLSWRREYGLYIIKVHTLYATGIVRYIKAFLLIICSKRTIIMKYLVECWQRFCVIYVPPVIWCRAYWHDSQIQWLVDSINLSFCFWKGTGWAISTWAEPLKLDTKCCLIQVVHTRAMKKHSLRTCVGLVSAYWCVGGAIHGPWTSTGLDDPTTIYGAEVMSFTDGSFEPRLPGLSAV